MSWVRTNIPISVRHGDDIQYIRILTAPPRRLVFWDDVPNFNNWYLNNTPNLFMCVGGGI